MTLQRGTRLGPYAIESPIGAGGMGEVYKATDTRLERTVAIKVLPAHVASDPERKSRFEREAKTVAALSHPHICPVFDVGREGETDFLVMEYLEGETLADRLGKGALPLDQALRYAIEIADALAGELRGLVSGTTWCKVCGSSRRHGSGATTTLWMALPSPNPLGLSSLTSSLLSEQARLALVHLLKRRELKV